MATQVPHGWSKEALLAKSQMFFEEMLRHPRDDWQFAHWSTLSLELLARAALAHISPTLLADERNWNNVYYALGHKPKASKFVPSSIGIVAVFNRLREILPDFTPDMGHAKRGTGLNARPVAAMRWYMAFRSLSHLRPLRAMKSPKRNSIFLRVLNALLAG